MQKITLAIKFIMFATLIYFGVSNNALAQSNDNEGYVGVARYGYSGANEPAIYFRAPIGNEFSFEGSVATLFDYVLRANAYYHVNSEIKLGLGIVEYKSGNFKDTGARLSAGYQLVQAENWQLNVLAGREFIFGDKNFVEMQWRYQFSERFSVFYHLQHNFSRRNEGYLGVGYRF
ncbi:hypothetical protein [Aliidiomarina sp.]|uniref:hypothetical protein n=1 Tax=Aliidiomarina sp. TaxID=1872439 RepID=UPI003A4D54DF